MRAIATGDDPAAGADPLMLPRNEIDRMWESDELSDPPIDAVPAHTDMCFVLVPGSARFGFISSLWG